MRRRGGLQRALFLAFGVAIVVTGLTFALVYRLVSGEHSPWDTQMSRLDRFAANRFAVVWDDPESRRDLARALADEMEMSVRVRDRDGETLEAFGEDDSCRRWREVVVPGRGTVEICRRARHPPPDPWVVVISLLVAAVVLWGVAGILARHLARPLRELTRVARDLGRGQLERRARLRHGRRGEVGELTTAINEMAARIERQILAERKLLATVSHELRTPLARIRLLLELGREDHTRDVLSEIEAELGEVDALVGDLLAGARVDFGALTFREVDAKELAERALARVGSTDAELEVQAEARPIVADATLLSRALVALLDNARKHGSGGVRLRIVSDSDHVRFEVEDDGPGFPPGESERVFEAFTRGSDTAAETKGVGLGLSIVRGIAEVHGGRAWAENRSEGGARVVMRVRRKPR